MPAWFSGNRQPPIAPADIRRPGVHLIGTDEPQLRELGHALRVAGAMVSGPTVSMPRELGRGAVAVVLSPELLARHDEVALSALVDQCADSLVLITSGITSGVARGKVFGKLSQRSLDREGIDAVAQHVLAIARAGGGEALSALDRLRAEANRWDQGGRPAQALLRGSRADDAVELVGASTDQPGFDVVGDFVAASSTAARRRERRLATVAVLTAVVLLAAGLSALWQRSEARAAETAAIQAAASARSHRLAQVATDLVEFDPDLPTLLAAQALESADTPAAAEAARRALTAVPPHRTFPVDGTPLGMATARNGQVVALLRGDGAVDVVSTNDGRRLAAIGEADGPAVEALLLSAEGDVLVVGGPTLPPTMYRAPGWEPEPADVPLAGALPKFWLDDERFVVVGDGASFTVDVDSGEATRYHMDDPDGAMVASAATGDVVVLRDGEVVVFDRSGAERRRVVVEDADSLDVSEDGRSLLVGHPLQVFELRLDKDGEPTRVEGASGGSVASVPGGFLVGSDDGRVSVVTPETGSTRRSFPAHRGPIMGVGALADGAYATVGADGLRVWQPSAEKVAYPLAPEIQVSDEFYRRGYALVREAARDKLAVDAKAGQLTVTIAGEHALTLDLETLELQERTSLFGGSGLLMLRPSDRMGEVLIWSTISNDVQLIDVASGEELWAVRPSRPIALGLVAVSSDGQAAAVANTAGMTIVSGTDGTSTTHPWVDAQSPVSLFVDDDAKGTAVFSSGDLIVAGEVTTTRATPPGVGALAAGWTKDGEGVVAGSDDRLYRAASGTPLVSYPSGLSPFAVSVSDDGKLAVVIGDQRTVLLSTEDGEVLLDLPARATSQTSVRDAVVAGDDLVTVRGDGSVERWPIWSRAELPELLRAARPRELSNEDLRIASIAGGS